jgi:hypothetical protein
VRWRRKSSIVTVCVGRGEHSERVLRRYRADLDAGLVVNPKRFIFVEGTGEASSTAVRAGLRELHDAATSEDRRRAIDDLIGRGLIDAAVGDYLLEHERGLYLD